MPPIVKKTAFKCSLRIFDVVMNLNYIAYNDNERCDFVQKEQRETSIHI